MSAGAALERLADVVRRLRAPDGCAWDRKQTLASMRNYLIEETYEVLDAIDADDAAAHREELGDLLFQIVFQAQLRAEAGAFDLAGVADAITEKMVRRHPHVFGDAPNDGQPMGRARWAAQKAQENPRRSALAGVPRAMPALQRGARLGAKASAVGFDWQTADAVLPVLTGELEELAQARAAADPEAIAHELGDVLFSVVNLARKLGVAPEEALQKANDRFEARFRTMEAAIRADGQAITDFTLPELDARWQAAKAHLRAQSSVD